MLYLDILGSKDMASDENAQSNLEAVFDALADARKYGLHDGKSYGDWYEMTAFTDHIVVGAPISEDGEQEFGIVINEACWYQFELATQGFFTRGGLAIGDAFVTPGFAFGQAISDAYVSETSAIYPRILLHKSVIPYVEKHRGYYGSPESLAPQDEELLCDQDGNVFVNYLGVINREEAADPDEALAIHKERIEAGLTKFAKVPKKLQKYEWLANLHNHWCRRTFPGEKAKEIHQSFQEHKLVLLHESATFAQGSSAPEPSK